MNIYNILAVFLSIILYGRLIYLLRQGSAGQNLATWVTWGLLDVVALSSIYVEGGNWHLLAMYVLGSVVISSLIWRQSSFKWEPIEITCILLVVTCIIVWKVYAPQYATIISTIGIVIATYPQLKDTFNDPESVPIEVFTGFTFVNIFATIAGKAWTVEERLYPAVCIVLSIVIVGLCVRKYFSKQPQST